MKRIQTRGDRTTGEKSKNSKSTKSRYTNMEVIAVDQDPKGIQGFFLFKLVNL